MKKSATNPNPNNNPYNNSANRSHTNSGSSSNNLHQYDIGISDTITDNSNSTPPFISSHPSNSNIHTTATNDSDNTAYKFLNNSIFGLVLLSDDKVLLNSTSNSFAHHNNSNSSTSHVHVDSEFFMSTLLFDGQNFISNEKEILSSALFNSLIRIQSDGLIEIDYDYYDNIMESIRSSIGKCLSEALMLIYINQGWNIVYRSEVNMNNNSSNNLSSSSVGIGYELMTWILSASITTHLRFLDRISSTLPILSSHQSNTLSNSLLLQEHFKTIFKTRYYFYTDDCIDHHVIFGPLHVTDNKFAIHVQIGSSHVMTRNNYSIFHLIELKKSQNQVHDDQQCSTIEEIVDIILYSITCITSTNIFGSHSTTAKKPFSTTRV
jgi:hypothetical protein